MKKRIRRTGMLLMLAFVIGLSAACSRGHEGDGTDGSVAGADTGAGQGEKEEFTLWTVDNATMTPGYEATDTARLVEEATRVHLKVTWVTMGEAKEKFGLMIASGDIPDMIYGGTDYYAGGAIQAVQDGIFQEMTNLIDQYMPHYKAILDSDEQVRKDVTSDDGKRYSIFTIYVDDDMKVSQNRNLLGIAVRRDWLEEAGLELPETISDWTEVLTAFRDMGVEAPLMIGSNGRLESGAFLSAYGVLEEYYLDGDRVCFGPAQPGYRQYLQQMKDWYDAGLIDSNFTANDRYTMLDIEDMGGNKVGAGQIWWQFGARELIHLGFPLSDKFFFEYAPYPVLHEGDTPKSGRMNSKVGFQLCISAEVSGERLERLCRYIDYHFTRESMLYHNYGEEGVHYDVDEKGEIYYSDWMTKDPENNVTWMRIQNLSNGVMAGAVSTEVDRASYPDGEGTECLDMQPVWNADSSLVYPAHATMTSGETEAYNVLYTGISTLVDEMSSKFILGVESLENFDAFVEQLYQYGLQECIDYKQAAYERYIRR